jgi:hypothetical protein
MKPAECMCTIRKAPWKKSLGHATYYIRYWDARITCRGIINNDDAVLIYYLLRSNVGKERFDTTMTITACTHQLTNWRSQLKDVPKDAKSNGSFYKLEVATARVEKRLLIPQVRMAHKYPISPWEMIHLLGGDNEAGR